MRITDHEIHTFILGTSRAGRMYDGKEADQIFGTFLDGGGKAIDTAHVYADWVPGERSISERCIGDYIARSGRRDDIFLITKGGHPKLTGRGYNGDDLHEPRLSMKEMQNDLDGSLEKLKTDVIDLYFYHRDDPDRDPGELIETMETFLRQGKIKAYGCSNWKLPRIMQAQEYAAEHGYHGFSANQVLYNLGTLKDDPQWDDTCVTADKEMLRYHQEHPEFVLMPYSANANGFFHTLIREGTQAVSKSPYCTDFNIAIAKEIQKLCKKRNCTVTQVMLGYFMSMDMRVLPLYASTDPEHVKEALDTNSILFNPADYAFANLLDKQNCLLL